MRLFVIGGKSGSGKTTLAKLIKEHYNKLGEKTIITEFSKYLKLYAYEMISWPWDLENKPRLFLQNMGEKVRREFGYDFFIKRVFDDIEIFKDYFDNVVIDDARLVEEIKESKFRYPDCITMYIESKEDNGLTEEEKNHVTEKNLDDYYDFDYNIRYVSLEKLSKELENILEEVK